MAIDLETRAARIRLPVRRIARDTGFNIRSVERVLRQSPDVRTGITNAVTAFVLQEERALLAHLMKLHDVDGGPALVVSIGGQASAGGGHV